MPHARRVHKRGGRHDGVWLPSPTKSAMVGPVTTGAWPRFARCSVFKDRFRSREVLPRAIGAVFRRDQQVYLGRGPPPQARRPGADGAAYQPHCPRQALFISRLWFEPAEAALADLEHAPDQLARLAVEACRRRRPRRRASRPPAGSAAVPRWSRARTRPRSAPAGAPAHRRRRRPAPRGSRRAARAGRAPDRSEPPPPSRRPRRGTGRPAGARARAWRRRDGGPGRAALTRSRR